MSHQSIHPACCPACGCKSPETAAGERCAYCRCVKSEFGTPWIVGGEPRAPAPAPETASWACDACGTESVSLEAVVACWRCGGGLRRVAV